MNKHWPLTIVFTLFLVLQGCGGGGGGGSPSDGGGNSSPETGSGGGETDSGSTDGDTGGDTGGEGGGSGDGTGELPPENRLPRIVSFGYHPAQPRVGETVTFSWQVDDPDGDILTCNLNVGGGTGLTPIPWPCPTTGERTTEYTSAGVRSIEFLLTDGPDVVTQTMPLTVEVNQAPVIESAAPERVVIAEGETVSFTWQVSDADDASLRCALDIDRDGTPELVQEPCGTGADHVFASAGSFTPQLSVVDPLGGTSTVDFSVQVARQRFAVDTTIDGVDAAPGDGQCATARGTCSLRAAVMESNALAEVLDSWGTTAVVELPAGEYVLTLADPDPDDTGVSGDLDLRSSIDLRGAGSALTVINGNGAQTSDRVFDIHTSSRVRMTGLTISGGNTADPGGAIRHAGSSLVGSDIVITNNESATQGGGVSATGGGIELSDCEISANRAASGGGIDDLSGNTLRLSDCRIINNVATQNGGGIIFGASNGSLDLTRSTIADNQAGAVGGGLMLSSNQPVDIVDSAISGNTANEGAGIYVNQSQSGVYGISVRLRNATVSSNTATTVGGGLYLNGPIQALFTTIADNAAASGGGIYVVDLRRAWLGVSVIAQNNAPTGPDCVGEVGSMGYSHIGSTDGCSPTVAEGDTTGPAGLGPLADNGGPTATHMPLAGSMLIDAKPAFNGGDWRSCLPYENGPSIQVDQRGLVRPAGLACDKGAVEVQP